MYIKLNLPEYIRFVVANDSEVESFDELYHYLYVTSKDSLSTAIRRQFKLKHDLTFNDVSILLSRLFIFNSPFGKLDMLQLLFQQCSHEQPSIATMTIPQHLLEWHLTVLLHFYAPLERNWSSFPSKYVSLTNQAQDHFKELEFNPFNDFYVASSLLGLVTIDQEFVDDGTVQNRLDYLIRKRRKFNVVVDEKDPSCCVIL
ncbi:hypothetical protein P9112_005319 [Eukaryota sp. TZLM1-RC]